MDAVDVSPRSTVRREGAMSAVISTITFHPAQRAALLAHVPAKWTPVRRQEHAPISSSSPCLQPERGDNRASNSTYYREV
jgi:hypothetical protein